jgi:hypothetical protein
MARIEGYSFGSIVIDGTEYTKDVIILPDRVISNWWRKDGHSLDIEDLAEVLDELPSRLVVGAGAYSRMKPRPEAVRHLEDRAIAVEILPTEDAVRRYSELDPAAVAAALHLTC